jgi:periplasmic divalent cation tolerance protein
MAAKRVVPSSFRFGTARAGFAAKWGHAVYAASFLSPLPSPDEARVIAQAILERKLAACVNILPGVESHYWWQGKLESGQEVMLIIKSSAEQFDALAALVKEKHSYECPEIVAVAPARNRAGVPAVVGGIALKRLGYASAIFSFSSAAWTARLRSVVTLFQSVSSESIQQRSFRLVEAAAIPMTMALGGGFSGRRSWPWPWRRGFPVRAGVGFSGRCSRDFDQSLAIRKRPVRHRVGDQVAVGHDELRAVGQQNHAGANADALDPADGARRRSAPCRRP